MQRVTTAMNKVRAGGGTPLYQAVQEAYGYTVSRYADGYTNQLIVLSDGANRDSTSAATLDGLLRYLRQTRDPKRPVRIVCIGYGADADIQALTKIAETTGGRAALAKTPEEVPDAVRLALFTL